MNKKKLHYVSYYFPPYNVIASQRAAKLCIEFSKLYDKVYVYTLSVNKIPVNKLDYEFYSDIFKLKNVEIKYVDLSNLGYEDSNNANLFNKIYSSFITKLICSNGFFWYKNLKKNIESNLSYNSELFITGSPFIIFNLGYFFKRKYGINYYLDYRDLWSKNPRVNCFYISRLIIQYFFEVKLLLNAKAIITVSNGCNISIQNLVPKHLRNNFYVLENLPDTYHYNFFKKYYDNIKTNSFYNITFTGTIYDNCTFECIANAIQLLPVNIINQIKINYYGNSFYIIHKNFNEFNLTHLLINHGYVSKSESIKCLGSADLLVSLVDDSEKIVNETINGLMTTKIFDYFLTKKTILNIGPVESDIAIFAKYIGYDSFINFRASEISHISKFLFREITNVDVSNDEQMIKLPIFSNKFNELKHIFS